MAFCLAIFAIVGGAVAQTTQDARRPAGDLAIRAQSVTTWTEAGETILLLRGNEDVPVTLASGEAVLSAERAVVWLRKLPGTARRRADVVLLGAASLDAGGVERTGTELAVDLVVDGRVNVDAPERTVREATDSIDYRRAVSLRPAVEAAPAGPSPADPTAPDGQPSTTPIPSPAPPTTAPRPVAVPVTFQAEQLRTLPGPDGKTVVEATGGIYVSRRTEDGDLVELQADRAVVFTNLDRLDEADDGDWRRQVKGVYLEGDVRVVYTPGHSRDRQRPEGQEQRLRAERAYYDFATERATLTDAVLHTASGGRENLPITLRADTIRQLAEGRYEALGAEISTSRFARPSYSLNASRVFVREDPGIGGAPPRTVFGGNNFTARLYGVPVFYFPVVRGASLDNRLPLRSVSVGNSRNFGTFALTDWGLWETFGGTPPRSVDAVYELDYFSERGPRVGLRADYGGDLLLPFNDGSPILFDGEFLARLLNDQGVDDLPGRRPDLEPPEWRYRVDAEHRQFFPGGGETGGQDFALFLRLGFLSDPTYLPVWDQERFNYGRPHDALLALQRRRGNELLGLEVNVATNEFPTIADEVQENAKVERFPELRYGRYGDRIGPFTLTSRNRLGVLALDRLSNDLADDFRFRQPLSGFGIDWGIGLPSYGYTGLHEQAVTRLDLRQELSAPLTFGPLRALPFVVGRFTGYSDSPEEGALARVFGGAGLRIGTTFARVDNGVYSRLLDLDRARHLIEPYAAAFTGLTNVGREELFIYDEGVDGYDEFSAVQVGLRQRWQTYRGPPGGKRSVDVLDINVSASLFDDVPDETPDLRSALRAPGDFRGLYFDSLPEASLARDAADAAARWRVSDQTAIVGDTAVSLEDYEFITAAGGLIADRGDRLRYYVGGRYVRPLDLVTLNAGGAYALGDRYFISGRTSVDIDTGDLRNNRLSITRRFERVFVDVSLYLDRIEDESGIQFVIRPADIGGAAFGSDAFGRNN